jgi:hypothetical protein
MPSMGAYPFSAKLQVRHDVDPLLFENVPGAHFKHSNCPVEFE